MEIPALVDYKFIKHKLDDLEQNEIIGYAENLVWLTNTEQLDNETNNDNDRKAEHRTNKTSSGTKCLR